MLCINAFIKDRNRDLVGTPFMIPGFRRIDIRVRHTHAAGVI